ncbi:MAG TPA: hypothetical protein EYH37_05090 [Aquifex aeolicus]|uniref:FIST domain-containing protein n=1 Tax=Aquifex aeolicus TaxID=63363 RepID=A0A9D0YPU8_AQUAO|nr:hypothetical protein [Aquifex aeolicus]
MIARVYYSRVPVLKFALEDVIRQLKYDIFYKSEDFDLAIIAFSPEIYPINESIVETFNEYLGENKWVAFHSVTSFVNDKTVEEGLVALFLKFQKNGNFSILTVRDLDKNYEKRLKETAEYINFYSKIKAINLMFASYSGGKIGIFIEDLNTLLKEPVNILGGVASGLINNGVVANVYTSEGEIRNGFAILTLKNVDFCFGLAQGLRTVGPIYKITKAVNNRIYEVNGEPVKNIMEKLIEGLPIEDIRIFWYSPIVILDEKEGIVSIVRVIKDIPDDLGHVEFWGPIKADWSFRFSFGLKEEMFYAGTKEALRVQKSLQKVELGFNFSCMGRQYALEDLHIEEARHYASIFNAPLFGFFTLGEIAPDKYRKHLKFYNQTSVVVGVKEL